MVSWVLLFLCCKVWEEEGLQKRESLEDGSMVVFHDHDHAHVEGDEAMKLREREREIFFSLSPTRLQQEKSDLWGIECRQADTELIGWYQPLIMGHQTDKYILKKHTLIRFFCPFISLGYHNLLVGLKNGSGFDCMTKDWHDSIYCGLLSHNKRVQLFYVFFFFSITILTKDKSCCWSHLSLVWLLKLNSDSQRNNKDVLILSPTCLKLGFNGF